MSIGLAVSVLECPSAPEVAGFHTMLGARITRLAPALHPEDRSATSGDRFPGVALVDPAGNVIRFVRMGYFDRFRPSFDAVPLSA